MTVRHVVISGRVQGVGYRDWTVATARTLGLAGWVRNRSDGTVEAVFSGEAGLVDHMLDACRAGPRHAIVSAIADLPVDDTTVHAGFMRRPTA